MAELTLCSPTWSIFNLWCIPWSAVHCRVVERRESLWIYWRSGAGRIWGSGQRLCRCWGSYGGSHRTGRRAVGHRASARRAGSTCLGRKGCPDPPPIAACRCHTALSHAERMSPVVSRQLSLPDTQSSTVHASVQLSDSHHKLPDIAPVTAALVSKWRYYQSRDALYVHLLFICRAVNL